MTIAEKTTEKINKETVKLENLKTKREEIVAKYEEKIKAIDDLIKEQTAVIKSLEKQKRDEKLSALASIAGEKGITVDELLEAALKDNFYGIQERIESNTQNTISSVSDIEDTDGPQDNYTAENTNGAVLERTSENFN